MTVILNSLKKSLDDVALHVWFGIEFVFHFEINFVRNANGSPVRMTERMNFIATVSPVSKHILNGKLKARKQFNRLFFR